MKTNILTTDRDCIPLATVGSAVCEPLLEDMDKAMRKRQQGAMIRDGYVSLFCRIVVIALAAWVLFSQLFLVTRMKGSEMFPAMKDGDLVIGFRLQQTLVKGDVVVYSHNGETRIGRVVARSGDVITLSSSGAMLVNGTTQSGEIMYPTYPKEGIDYPYTVPEGNVFIMGDYRTQSEDSRDFGPVSTEDVAAKVITVLRRRTL